LGAGSLCTALILYTVNGPKLSAKGFDVQDTQERTEEQLPEGTDAEALIVDWSEVQAKTGVQAKRKGLADYKGRFIKLSKFADEKRGKKNVHWVMSAVVSADGEDDRVIIVPDRYANKLREYIKRLGERANGLELTGTVELSPKGSIMIRPANKPAVSPNGTTGRRGRPRKNTTQAA